MKYHNIHIGAVAGVLLMFVMTAFSSCYDDKSTLATRDIPKIELDLEDMPDTYYVELDEELVISPKMTTKYDANLQFDWYVSKYNENEYSNDLLPIGQGNLELKYKVERPIDSRKYIIKLVITDTSHDNIQSIYTWKMEVRSPFISGILVAETKDEAHSDFTYIKNESFTRNYKDKPEAIIRNVLKTMGTQPINGFVDRMTYSTSGRQWSRHKPQLWALLENGKVMRYNSSDYKPDGNSDLDNLILYKPIDDFKIKSIFKGGPYLFGWTNAGVYTIFTDDTKLNVFTNPVDVLEKSSARNNVIATNTGGFAQDYCVWVQDDKGSFVALGKDGRNIGLRKFSKGDEFNPSDLGSKKPLAAVIDNDDKNCYFLMQDGNKYAIYSLILGGSNKDGGISGKVFNVPESVGGLMSKAVDFFFSKTQKILYFATDKDLYAVSFGIGDTTTGGEAPIYTVPAGEKIKLAKLYLQGEYCADKNTLAWVGELKYNLTAVIIGTQASSGGVVHIIPLNKDNLSRISSEDKEFTYDGFGRILDIISVGS